MSVAAPLFLLGLLACIVPWVLHRLNQHDAPVQDFPSDQFLESTTTVSARKKQLRYLKLLALRLLLIALLCLLFAEPAIKRFGNAFGDTDKLHLIVVDKSFSMPRDGLWEAATTQVTQILDSLLAGNRIQLLSAGAGLSRETDVTLDRQSIESAMIAVEPGYERLRYGELMRQLSAHAEKAELPVFVHIVSDMQASAIPVRANDLVNRSFHALELYDVSAQVADELPSNAALRTEARARDQDSFDLVAEISRFGQVAESAVEQSVSLYKEGELLGRQVLTPGSNDTVIASFESLQWPAGSTLEKYELKLEPGDKLSQDDTDLVAVRREPDLPVAIVSNATRQQRLQSVDELYLQTALALDPRNVVTSYSPETLNPGAGPKVIIYLDHLALQDNTLPVLPEKIQQQLDEGVHVLYVLNASAQRLDVPLDISSARAAHPLALDIADWEDVRFFALQPLQTAAGQSALLDAGADYPVLIEQQPGQGPSTTGRLLWLNAALNGADNSLPVSPVFVPFLRDVIDYFARADVYPRELSVGEGLRLRKSVQLLDPAGKPMLELADLGKGKTQLLTRPGVYTLLESSDEFPIKVVSDIAESDVRRADTADIERWRSSAPADSVMVADSATASSASLVTTGNNDALFSLTRWLLPAGLLLVLLESFYANWHLRTRRH